MTLPRCDIMTVKIPMSSDGKRLLDFLRKELKLSRAAVTALKNRENGIMLEGRHVTVREILREGEILTLAIEDRPENENPDIKPVCIPLSILYEDSDVIVVNKPSGMPTHPSHNHQNDTLANALVYYFKKNGVPFVFRAVNRLDRDTSGCVLVAKNKQAAFRLSKAFSSREIQKKYLAVVSGKLDKGGVIETNIKRREESMVERTVCDKTEGQTAKTIFSPICFLGDPPVTLLSVTPVTGRTHQIRVHLSYIGYPILGDTLYGDPTGDSRISRQALHCSSLTFPTADGADSITVTAPLFEDMAAISGM